jgi:hypothetical protein
MIIIIVIIIKSKIRYYNMNIVGFWALASQITDASPFEVSSALKHSCKTNRGTGGGERDSSINALKTNNSDVAELSPDVCLIIHIS